MEAGVAERAAIMTIRGVEHAPLTVRADPRPRFLPLPLLADLQDVTVDGVVLRMHVGLVPCTERVEALRDRVLRIDNLCFEFTGAVPRELGADELHVGVRISEAIRRTVQRYEPAAIDDVVEERFLLLGGDLIEILINDQRVVLGERLRIEVADVLGVFDLDPAIMHHRDELFSSVRRSMVTAVPEEQHIERGGSRLGGCTKNNRRREASQDREGSKT